MPGILPPCRAICARTLPGQFDQAILGSAADTEPWGKQLGARACSPVSIARGSMVGRRRQFGAFCAQSIPNGRVLQRKKPMPTIHTAIREPRMAVVGGPQRLMARSTPRYSLAVGQSVRILVPWPGRW